jgi:hypothetical protein
LKASFGAARMAAGDFNRDGELDFVLLTFPDSTRAQIYLGTTP